MPAEKGCTEGEAAEQLGCKVGWELVSQLFQQPWSQLCITESKNYHFSKMDQGLRGAVSETAPQMLILMVVLPVRRRKSWRQCFKCIYISE